MKTSWRIAPSEHLAREVRALALAEGRSDTAMLTRLISEALSQRRKADTAASRLVEILKAPASEPAQ
jgi:hypothetical protein